MNDIVREYTADMGEISGFGGGYEATCRKMVLAGVQWSEEHPGSDPKFHGYKNVFGLIVEDNDDAKALSKAMVDAADGDCTGAMMQACMGHVFFIRQNSWEKYVEEMRKKDPKE